MCRWRVETGRMSGIAVEDLQEFYLGGRAASTIAGYRAAFKYVMQHAVGLGTPVFYWGEGEVAGLVVRLAKEEQGENMMKRCSAVVNLLFEVAGFEAPTKGETLKKVKLAAVKRMNVNKVKKTKKPMSVEDMEKMIQVIYLGRVKEKERQRFLVLMVFTFFGVKRFSDVNRVKVKDVDFKKDGSLEVFVRSSKTDSAGKGAVFKLTGQKNAGVSVGNIVSWYIRSLKLGSEDYLFCKLGSGGKVLGKDFLRYGEARVSLEKEQKKLGLEGLSLHSGRVGGATEASALGVARAEIKEAGGWRSDQVDLYIHPKGKGKTVSRALMGKLRI